MLCVFLVLCCLNVAFGGVLRDDDEQPSCGYQSCHPTKANLTNVHIVAHTHDDVGWLKTFDQYYYGANNSIQNAGVQYILDSVIAGLNADPDRRFIYVETSYFWKWWMKQHDFVKHKVRALVNAGRLEFIGGAWSMNDEATVDYQSTIDQFTWGLRKLNDTFGACGRPKIGWQIDPFGHSREQASLFAQMGYDGLLLGRIDYQDKVERFARRSPEMIWRGSPDNLGDSADIFTGVMYNTYAPPKGFCFDILCQDEPLVEDKKSPLYNIERKVDDFFAYLDNLTQVYQTNNLIITMGEDFTYQDANTWFKNLDILIDYANRRQVNGSKYNLIYSTPSCYVKAVHDAKKQFLAKQDDFFPYASDPHSFWTGYFVSRPTLKRFIREGHNYLQICKQLYALTNLGPEDRVDLNRLREAMGVMQHHDAITGTEKQHVAEDYARILTEGLNECHIIVNAAFNKLMNQTSNQPTADIPVLPCPLANISSCSYTETLKAFSVTVYNPLSRPVRKYVRLPVTGKAYSVKDPDGKDLPTQIIPIHEATLRIPGRKSAATVELIFEAEDIPPLGFKSYFITQTSGDAVNQPSPSLLADEGPGFKIDQVTGLLTEATLNGIVLRISQQFFYYEGFVGNNSRPENRSSGAYIFRPIPGKDATPIAAKAQYKIFQGELVSEVQQTFNEWTSQTIRIYTKENFIEFDWQVGPIPNQGPNGREVITRFHTALETNSTFYTDSNGRESLKRTRNFRPTWKLSLEEPVSGNYYPITSKISLLDDSNNVQASLITDRAQAGSSLKDGDLEVMLHRNCLHDDAFGVGEALNETAFGQALVAKGSLYLVIGPRKPTQGKDTTAVLERDLAQKRLLDSWFFVSPVSSLEAFQKLRRQFGGLQHALPKNVQILTLEPWIGFSLLLRLEHVLEKGEDPQWSKAAVVDLEKLFQPFDVVGLRETTLAANQWLKDSVRLEFGTHDGTNKREALLDAGDDFKIVLNPMQIRTFVIDVKMH